MRDCLPIDAELVQGLRLLLEGTTATVERAIELAPLLKATGACAAGCWSYTQENLELRGFLAVPEMPPPIQAEFVASTRRVPLSRSEFGIVQAVLRRGPAINHRRAGPIAGSPGWLDRFGASSSLAVPVFRGERLLGAFAVATTEPIVPGDEVWRLVTTLAERWFP